MADSQVIEREHELAAQERASREPHTLEPRDAQPRTVMVPFDLLWLQVIYRRWPQDDHWQDPVIGQIDLYADPSAAKLLGEDLTLDSFTPDQASMIRQNIDLVLFRQRHLRGVR